MQGQNHSPVAIQPRQPIKDPRRREHANGEKANPNAHHYSTAAGRQIGASRQAYASVSSLCCSCPSPPIDDSYPPDNTLPSRLFPDCHANSHADPCPVFMPAQGWRWRARLPAPPLQCLRPRNQCHGHARSSSSPQEPLPQPHKLWKLFASSTQSDVPPATGWLPAPSPRK